MAEKSLFDRYGDEVLTDNSRIKKCEQCKDCAFWDTGDPWSHYTKASCQIYSNPDFKPIEVVEGTEECEFYEKEE